jgi:hypothetical protein
MKNPWVVGKRKRLAGNSFPKKTWMAGNRPSWRERKKIGSYFALTSELDKV